MKKLRRTIAYLLSIALIVSCVLSPVGSTYGRPIHWATSELIVTPENTQEYFSDCLVIGGQFISLKSWMPTELTREVVINITRPAVVEEVVTEDVTEEVTETEDVEITTDTVVEESTVDTTIDVVVNATDVLTEPTDEVQLTEGVDTAGIDNFEDQTLDVQDLEDVIETENQEITNEIEPDEVTDVILVLDEETLQHFVCHVIESENTISITIERVGQYLETITCMSIYVEWKGLSGTIVFETMPYGEIPAGTESVDNLEPEVEETESVVEETIDESDTVETESIVLTTDSDTETDGRVIVTGLELFTYNDTVDYYNQVVCIKLNLETCTDFNLSFLLTEKSVNMVRWSLDNQTYTLLYDQSELNISYPYVEGWDGILFVDFSYALQDGQRPTVVIEATGYDRREISPIPMALPNIQDLVITPTETPCHVGVNTVWGMSKLEITDVEVLESKNGEFQYKSTDSIVVWIETGGVFIIKNSEMLGSGTYRISYKWVWNDVVIEEKSVNLFVNAY